MMHYLYIDKKNVHFLIIKCNDENLIAIQSKTPIEYIIKLKIISNEFQYIVE